MNSYFLVTGNINGFAKVCKRSFTKSLLIRLKKEYPFKDRQCTILLCYYILYTEINEKNKRIGVFVETLKSIEDQLYVLKDSIQTIFTLKIVRYL